jgi:hypothetical protein
MLEGGVMNRSQVRWFCGAIAALMVISASADPPTYKFNSRSYGNWVTGGSCSDAAPGVYRCREVRVWENYDVKGTFQYTEVYYQNERHEYDPSDESYDDRWRYIVCPVDEDSIGAHPNHVTIDVLLDSEGPGCYQYGYREGWNPSDGYYFEPWGFTGLWAIEGEWRDPFSYGSSMWNGNYKNYHYDGWSGSDWKEHGVNHCKSSWGDLMTRGGLSVTNPSGSTFFYEFDGPDGAAWSYYNVSSCNEKNMQK